MRRQPRRRRRQKEGGFITSLELIFIATSLLSMLAIGSGALGSMIAGELSDLGSAVGGLSQSYRISGGSVGRVGGAGTEPGGVSFFAGSQFHENPDWSGAQPLVGVQLALPRTETARN